MHIVHSRPTVVLAPAEPAPITPPDIARALFDASERIVMAPSAERQVAAIEANTALWFALGAAAADGLIDLPGAVCRRIVRAADTVARRSVALRPGDIGGALPMRLVRLNDFACRAVAPPPRRRRPIAAPPPGAH
ncbi:hypothetical protein [Caenispirillum bisanense]|uniref:Uncharacterized protein n=1 Tax=Caenispirillum bisanense TaxID=414052 RepID=A0A286GZL9_9PROT|nr:hypothetical protein [Caenispirillum bisanense]SOE00980.1 hypothetical protein SAMN05421508_11539 [Caenispirillum bisanense]